ncbi:MAG: sulfatase-like hydrolase/transferase, partial [Fuerstiella sp.]|nr:sulfatase-like hydrolase/transferase [Fuerstiella sp.]
MCQSQVRNHRHRLSRTARNLLLSFRCSRQTFARSWSLLFTKAFAAAALMIAVFSQSTAAALPNILWITAEDMSPALGCYGDSYATTPNIDQLATESVRYTHSFATAPVCSPVRSCLITGCYATSLGTHNMRSAFPLPPSIRGFPALLKDAGYFTSNNVKTDYNTSDSARLIDESWDESSDTAHWRSRRDKTAPFFSVFNLMTSHQSRTMVWPY